MCASGWVTETTTAARSANTSLSICPAWHWHELRAVAFLLEIRADDERLCQVGRVVDDRRDGEPFVDAVGEPIEVFGQHGVFAVRNAVLPQPAGPHVGGDHLERGPARWWPPCVGGATLADAGGDLPGDFPPCHGVTLGLACHRRRGSSVEAKAPRLLTRVSLDFQRVVVFPRDPDPARHAHE